MEQNKSPLSLLQGIYLVEIRKKYKRMRLRHIITGVIIIAANATAGVLLDINTFMFLLESFVLGLTLGKYWKIKRHNFMCEVQAFWEKQKFDNSPQI